MSDRYVPKWRWVVHNGRRYRITRDYGEVVVVYRRGTGASDPWCKRPLNVLGPTARAVIREAMNL